ncbi:hypothetical protein FKW77_005377 [Venturia effusa]|uniref:Uncharacterized protein n=1 Tax=Venturia effusa TaxID=50376 RepID=A0A517LDW4_9PEZI|nr:hypothetical protein FKW77_005377 [Venturia effusa]
MASNVHGRPIAQPRGSAGRFGVGAAAGKNRGATTGAGAGVGVGGQQGKSPEEDFEEQQRQCRAATILESNEMLVWAGMDMCESLAQTKLHFERELFCLPPDDSTKEWPESFTYSSEEEGTLQTGAVFTSQGWYDPKKHTSVADRLRAQEAREKAREAELEESRREESRSIGSPGVAMKDMTRATGEERKRKSPGGRLVSKRTSGVGVGKRTPSGSGSGNGL